MRWLGGERWSATHARGGRTVPSPARRYCLPAEDWSSAAWSGRGSGVVVAELSVCGRLPRLGGPGASKMNISTTTVWVEHHL
jgi:hypothetical protein